MSQPIWKLIANLGDVTPLSYGGFFIYTDTTGVYAPEAELLEVLREPKEPPEDADETWEDDTITHEVYRFALEPCTFINGVLSDNKFHPGKAAWFAKPEAEKANRPQDSTYLSNVADTSGIDAEELVRLFTSADPLERAQAWRAVGECHGFDNLDNYPLKLTRAEAVERYK